MHVLEPDLCWCSDQGFNLKTEEFSGCTIEMTAVVVGRRVTLPGPFVGDHDNMVDRLIEACAAVKQRTFVSFERELQPCTEAWLEPAK